MPDIERLLFQISAQLPDSQTLKLKKWMMTMLAEIFLLKLEAMMRVEARELRAASSDPRFIPVVLPH